jgi:hypothetical protein
MITALITLLIIGLAIALFYWLCDVIPIPQPLNRWVKIAIICVGVIALIVVLAKFGGIALG